MADQDDSNSSSDSGWRDKAKRAGNSLSKMGAREHEAAAGIASSIRPVPYKRGGKVRKGKRRGKGRRKSR